MVIACRFEWATFADDPAAAERKTRAYLGPLLSRIEPGVPLQLLILLPSRELALQVAAAVRRLACPPDADAAWLLRFRRDFIDAAHPADGCREQDVLFRFQQIESRPPRPARRGRGSARGALLPAT